MIFLILIGFVEIAFGQYIGDKLPPGTMIPDYDGDYIFPPDYVDFYYSDSHFEKYSVTDQQYRYDIPYMISNGTISNMNINCSDVELVLNVNPSGNKGWITLALPRVLVDSKMDFSNDDKFFVLLDSKEVSHPDIPAEKLRIVIIPLYSDTSQVKVIGVNHPEHAGGNACNGKDEPPFSYLLSPLKQTNNDISFNEIQCKQNLVLIQKYDGTPACVTESTKTKLVERGWTKKTQSIPEPERDPKPEEPPKFITITGTSYEQICSILQNHCQNREYLRGTLQSETVYGSYGLNNIKIEDGQFCYKFERNQYACEPWLGKKSDFKPENEN